MPPCCDVPVSASGDRIASHMCRRVHRRMRRFRTIQQPSIGLFVWKPAEEMDRNVAWLMQNVRLNFRK